MAEDSIGRMRRRVWCETLSFEELCAPAVLRLLARFRLDVLLAVRPWHLGEVGEVVARLRGAGLHVALWPMLDDARGRWASARSAPAFAELVAELAERAPAAAELVIDLEPAIFDLTRWKAWRPSGWGGAVRGLGAAGAAGVAGVARAAAVVKAARASDAARPGAARRHDRYALGREVLARAALRWCARDGAAPGQAGASSSAAPSSWRVSTAVMPVVPFDGAGQWMQRALGTPADDLPVQHHSVMAYTSLLEGWSRGLVDRRRAEWLLAVCARKTRARWGTRAGLSLGAVGTGAFGDEPVYRGPLELARDVAIARAAGIDELSLFELGGVLRRPPAEAWLEALWGERAPVGR